MREEDGEKFPVLKWKLVLKRGLWFGKEKLVQEWISCSGKECPPEFSLQRQFNIKRNFCSEPGFILCENSRYCEGDSLFELKTAPCLKNFGNYGESSTKYPHFDFPTCELLIARWTLFKVGNFLSQSEFPSQPVTVRMGTFPIFN